MWLQLGSPWLTVVCSLGVKHHRDSGNHFSLSCASLVFQWQKGRKSGVRCWIEVCFCSTIHSLILWIQEQQWAWLQREWLKMLHFNSNKNLHWKFELCSQILFIISISNMIFSTIITFYHFLKCVCRVLIRIGLCDPEIVELNITSGCL